MPFVNPLHIVLQNGAFCVPKVAVLHSKSGSFAFQKWQFCVLKVAVLQNDTKLQDDSKHLYCVFRNLFLMDNGFP